MQILIQGSGRRVRLTKSEVGKLRAAQTLLKELQRSTGEGAGAVAGIDAVMCRIDDKGEYKSAAETESSK